MSNEPWEDPEVQAFLKGHSADVFPKIRSSRFGITFGVENPDPRAMLEMGYMAYLDKPMIGIVMPGVAPSRKMSLIVDAWVEWNEDPTKMAAALADAIKRLGVTE